MEAIQAAQICHEANRAYCSVMGDDSQPAWNEAPDWQKDSAVKGVEFHLHALRLGDKPTPSASHDSWLAEKRAAGWKYGPIKNPDLKEHPCFLPYEKLPAEQQGKDFVFAGIVESLYHAGLI
jgi:hypothetical protein